jgi:hypothetical protein
MDLERGDETMVMDKKRRQRCCEAGTGISEGTCQPFETLLCLIARREP